MTHFLDYFLPSLGIITAVASPFILMGVINNIFYFLERICEILELKMVKKTLSLDWKLEEIKQPPNPDVITFILKAYDREKGLEHKLKFSELKQLIKGE